MLARPATAADIMAPNPVTLTPDVPVARALALMREKGIHEIPVVAGKRFRGLVSLDEIAHRTNLPLTTKVGNLLVVPPLLSPSTPWEEVNAQLLLSGLRAAPVLDPESRVAGIVSRSDLISLLPRVAHLDDVPAEDIMSPIVRTIGEREGVGALIADVRDDPPVAVLDHRGRLVGSIGIRDLNRAFWRPKVEGKGDLPRERADRGTVTEVEARSIMRTPAIAVPQGTSVASVVDLLVRERVSTAFVLRNNAPVGVVGQSEILQYVAEGHPASQARDQVYVRLHGFAAPSDPDTLQEIDQTVAQGLSRIRRKLPVVLLDLHITPEGVHRSRHVTVSARLHTSRGILNAHRSDWDLRTALAQVLAQLERQSRERVGRTRRAARARIGIRHLHPRPPAEPEALTPLAGSGAA